VIDAARERIIVNRAASPLKPGKQAGARIVHQLELNRSTGLLLNDDRARPNVIAAHNLADLALHDVAAPKLAVDRQVEQRSIANAPMLIKKEANCLNLAA